MKDTGGKTLKQTRVGISTNYIHTYPWPNTDKTYDKEENRRCTRYKK